MAHISDTIEPCGSCRSPLAPDQRYCLQCGERRGAPRVDFEHELGLAPDPAPALVAAAAADVAPTPQRPARLIAAGLAGVTIALGAVLGAAIGPSSSPSLAASATPAVIPLAATPAPAATPATSDTAPATTTDSPAPSSSDSSTSALDAGSPVASDPTTRTTTPTTHKKTSSSDPKPAATPSPTVDTSLPDVKHVWVITLTGQDASTAFPASASASAAQATGPPTPYLAGELASDGTVLTHVVPVAPTAVANGVALLSGQGPTEATTAGCPNYVDVTPADVDASTGFAQGEGCVYPAAVTTLPGPARQGQEDLARVRRGRGSRLPAPGARRARPVGPAPPG